MKSNERVIKFFVCFLVFLFLGSIFGGLINFTTSRIIGVKHKNKTMPSKTTESLIDNPDQIGDIDIKLKNYNLELKSGSKFSVEAPEGVKVKKVNDKLIINQDSKYDSFFDITEMTVTITVPERHPPFDFEISIGFGSVKVAGLKMSELDLESGAGDIDFYKTDVEKDFEIKSGIGDLKINSCNLKNVRLKLGTGDAVVNAKISGNSEIAMGVGDVNINLLGERSDYTIMLKNFIGEANIDGKKANESEKIGSGPNIIEIKSGIGSLNILFNGFDKPSDKPYEGNSSITHTQNLLCKAN